MGTIQMLPGTVPLFDLKAIEFSIVAFHIKHVTGKLIEQLALVCANQWASVLNAQRLQLSSIEHRSA